MAFEDGIPEVVDGPAAYNEVVALFRPSRDYSYRTFQGFQAVGLEMDRGMFTGSLWRSLELCRVSLRRCDFNGNRLEKCVFREVDFSNADIRSTLFAGCRFERCRFDGALLDDCTFDNCELCHCSYADAAQRDVRFRTCTLVNLNLERSSFTLGQFEHCRLKQMHLADCTILYVLMVETTFTECAMNLETLGTVFGLQARHLDHLVIRYLGRDMIPQDRSGILDTLAALYEGRRWAMQLAVSRINFGLTSISKALEDYLETFSPMAARSAPIRRDELTFFAMILESLYSQSRLPLLAVVKLTDLLEELVPAPDNVDATLQPSESLATFAARISMLSATMLQAFERNIPTKDLAEVKNTIWTLQLTFEQRPSIDLPTMVNQAAVAAGLRPYQPACRVDATAGSYIEVLQMGTLTVFTLYVMLFLVNGILIQLQEAKARLRQLRSERIPPRFMILARRERQAIPPTLREPLTQLLHYAKTLPWTSSPDVGGLDARNLRSAKLLSIQEGDAAGKTVE